jgi:hypothetical protein
MLLNLEPFLDEVPHEDPAAGLPLLVDLVQQLRQLDLRLLLCVACLFEISLLSGQRIPACVHDCSEPGAVVLDVAALPRSTCHKEESRAPGFPNGFPRQRCVHAL